MTKSSDSGPYLELRCVDPKKMTVVYESRDSAKVTKLSIFAFLYSMSQLLEVKGGGRVV
jgi:hypothetical protein